jgi:hypothetical protein
MLSNTLVWVYASVGTLASARLIVSLSSARARFLSTTPTTRSLSPSFPRGRQPDAIPYSMRTWLKTLHSLFKPLGLEVHLSARRGSAWKASRVDDTNVVPRSLGGPCSLISW